MNIVKNPDKMKIKKECMVRKFVENQTGSLTIELALLAGILMGILILFLQLGFFWRDFFVVNQCCRMIVAIDGRELELEIDSISDCSYQESELKEFLQSRMIQLKIEECQLQYNERYLHLICESHFPFAFFGSRQMRIEQTYQMV